MTQEHPARRSTSPTGRELVRESWRQLKAARSVAALPLLGGFAATVLFLAVVVPGFILGAQVPEDHTRTIVLTVSVILGGIPATLVATFFQGAVVSAALQQSEGGQPTITTALAGARARFGPLLLWGLMVATVDVVLSLIRDKNNIFSSIVSVAGELAWSAATFLALPVVVAEGRRPFTAVKKSASLLKHTWGSAIRVTVRFGFVLLPVVLGTILLVVAGSVVLALGTTTGGVGGISEEIIGLLLIATGLVVLVVGLAIVSTLRAYVTTQLYLYASGLPTSVPVDLVRAAVQVA